MPECAATTPIGEIRSPTHTLTAISPPCALMNANHTVTSHEVKWPILEATDGVLAGKWLKKKKNSKEGSLVSFPSLNYI